MINPKCEETELLINDAIDGDISSEDRLKLNEHLETCLTCKEIMVETKFLKTAAHDMRQEIMPKHDLWLGIHKSIITGIDPVTTSRQRSNYRYYLYAFAAVAVLAAIVILFTNIELRSPDTKSPVYMQIGTFWKVTSTEGTPKIERENNEQSTINNIDSIKTGEYVVTDAISRAVIMVANIGTVMVAPNSRVKFVNGGAGNNRIQLEYGTIDANITADPREFFVESQSATVVDYGCAYTFSTDSSGDGVIYVKEGMVKLESENRESIVPAGKMCLTKKDIGPGTPYSAASTPEFKKALINFDFNNCTDECVRKIVNNAGNNDIYTLVSMAPRVDDEDRVYIYNKISGYAKPHRNVHADTIKFNTNYWKEWTEELSKQLKEELPKHMDEIQIQVEKSMELMNEVMENMNFQFQFSVPDIPGDNEGKHKFRMYRKYKGDDGKYYETEDTVVYFDKKKFKEEMKQFKEDMKNFKMDMKKMEIDLKQLDTVNWDNVMKQMDDIKIDINIDGKVLNEDLQREIQESVRIEMDKVREELDNVRIEINRELEEAEKERKEAEKEREDSLKDREKEYEYKYEYNK